MLGLILPRPNGGQKTDFGVSASAHNTLNFSGVMAARRGRDDMVNFVQYLLICHI